jgi:hypothetical protein
MNADGKQQRCLYNQQTARMMDDDNHEIAIRDYAWMPDSASLICVMQTRTINKDGQFAVMDELSRIDITGTVKWRTQSPHNFIGSPAVSPDGKRVAASRIPWHKELRRMKLP